MFKMFRKESKAQNNLEKDILDCYRKQQEMLNAQTKELEKEIKKLKKEMKTWSL